MYQIEKNVPAPNQGNFNGPVECSFRLKYPLDRMDIGDSFFVPLNGQKSLYVLQRRLSSTATQYGRRHYMKFVTSGQGDGVRVWRIS